MSIRTAKSKTLAKNGRTSRNGMSANGRPSKTPKPKKSMYEKWIEKYGIDDSPSAKSTLKMWHMIYDAHNKPRS